MKSFTSFFRDEYLVLEDIEHFDNNVFKKVINESAIPSDEEVNKIKSAMADKDTAKKYLENEEEDRLMHLYKKDPHSEEGRNAAEVVANNKIGLAKYLVYKAMAGGVVPPENQDTAFEGALEGLRRAIELWDPEKNEHFGPWAKEQMFWGIRNFTNPKRKKSVDERTHENSVTSIDAPIEAGGFGKGDNNSEASTIGDKISDQSASIPGEDQAEIYAMLNSFLSRLPEKEMKAVRYYYLGDDDDKKINKGGKRKGLTFDEIGKRLNMTKVGARSVVNRATTKLRTFMEDHGIDASTAFAD